MRLVMKCYFNDGYTYYCEAVYPIVSESVEQAYCDFVAAYEEAKTGSGDFTFFGEEFDCYSFEEDGEFYPPDFFTLDQWFKGVEK